ncbi:MAG: exodeoxyribonuclease VII large subunit [Deltaproteobacteria bacterium]|nr:MAG: exodeoxyribonuclease VII large subunit [Deltaproteobacteria bacterium]
MLLLNHARRPVVSSHGLPSRTYHPLSRVVGRLEQLLEPALKSPPFWVRAEVSSPKEHNGNLYCDLVETRDGTMVARMRCVIWRSDLVEIRREFEANGLELALEDGAEIGLQCRPTFHTNYGLSLRGLALDPEFALGALERKRREILERLLRENLLFANASRPDPLIPNRVGVVTSVGSAGCTDFVETARRSPYGVRILLADARMQGTDTEATVVRALDALDALDVCLVVIVRGGGSRTDLAYLDNEAIARRIASMSKPVWTGIGHETDRSVLDEVAARACKTPTAVAERIVERLDSVARSLQNATERLHIEFEHRMQPNRTILADAAKRLARGPTTSVCQHRERLGAIARAVAITSSARVDRESLHVEALRRAIAVRAAGVLGMRRQEFRERRKSLVKTTTRIEQRHRERLHHARTRLLAAGVARRFDHHRDRIENATRMMRVQSRRLLGHERTRIANQRARLSVPHARLGAAREQLRSHHKSLLKTSARWIASRRLLHDGYRRRLRGPLQRREVAGHAAALRELTSRLAQAATARLRTESRGIAAMRERFQMERFIRQIEQARAQHRSFERTLRASDPRLALERGYSMTLDERGELIQSIRDLTPGTVLRTEVRDGTIVSVVDRTEGTE